jgi:hypothetical protein
MEHASPEEINARFARLEKQRNEALTNEAVLAGQLAASLNDNARLEEKVRELNLALEENNEE